MFRFQARARQRVRTRVLPPLVLAMSSLAAAEILAASPGYAASAMVYVDQGNPACTDAGSGSLTEPLCTLVRAGVIAVPGQTVEVASGVYTGTVTVNRDGTVTDPIVFVAAAGADVTVTGGTYGFKMSAKSYVTVQGFTITGTTGHGVYVGNSDHIVVRSNHVTDAGRPVEGAVARGIYVSETSDSLVEGNVVDYNSDTGIYVGATGVRITITRNVASYNARKYMRSAAGIDVKGDSNVVTFNTTHHNEDTGLQFYTGASDNLVASNVTYENGDHGIDNLGATNQVITGNTVYRNVAAGINVEGFSTGAQIFNNIAVDNGVNSPRTKSNIRVDKDSLTGTVLDFNLTYLSTVAGPDYIWGTAWYNTVTAFRTATGQEQTGIQVPPRWAAPAAGNFNLLTGSPAIDSAASGAVGQTDVDLAGQRRIDDLATLNTGTGPRPYDDRGALEFQPAP